MDLYFSPLASSVASRIALYEAGAPARFIEVDTKTKRTIDGSDYVEIYPLGLVPLLRLDDGSLLSENAAILQYIASRYPLSKLAPTDGLGRARLQQWLSFMKARNCIWGCFAHYSMKRRPREQERIR